MIVVCCSLFIFDAIDKLITESAMGVAYTKLMEKEEKFSNAIQSLYQTESPVDGIVGYPANDPMYEARQIPKYTNSNINYYDGDGNTLTNGQTIKGILAMAAVYIDQDFAKYGNILSFSTGFGQDGQPDRVSLLGSTYKDYVAALYDATHLVGIEPDDQTKVYYCDDPYNAPADCNNVITDIDHGTTRDTPPEGCDDYTETEHYKTITTGGGTDAEGNALPSSTERVLDYVEYTCKANHEYCGGHIDMTADIVISNIYYPPSETSSAPADNIEFSDPSNPEEEADGTVEYNPEDVVEPGYSMYVLDKYATAVPQTQVSDEMRTEGDANMARDTAQTDGTSEPHTEILDILNKVISKVEGKEDVTISRYVYWPENDPVIWDRHPTYYYIKDDGDINDNEKVTGENGTAYRFVSYTSESAFNPDFAEHGWDEGSRQWVQALLIPDWYELYGINVFGCLTGTPLSEEQIQALIASNPEWQDLSPARQYLMALCLTLPEGHPYNSSGQPSGRYAAAAQPAMSCAGFVRWLYWSAFDMDDFPGYTASINSQLKTDSRFEHYVGIDNIDKLEPGDIILKRDGGSDPDSGQWNHVLIYAGKNEAGQRVYFHESGSKRGYRHMSTYDFSGYADTIQIYKLKDIDSMEVDYGINTSGTSTKACVTIDGNRIWVGWEHNESGGKGVASIGDGGWGFGIFQFDSRYDSLYNFMERCMDEFPGEYDSFAEYVNNRNHYQTIGKLGEDFNRLWKRLMAKNSQDMKELQYAVFYKDYYEPAERYGRNLGIDMDSLSPVMKGTIWSISIYAGTGSTVNGYNGKGIGCLNILKNGLDAGKDEEDILREIYNEAATYKSGITERWNQTQLKEALAAL